MLRGTAIGVGIGLGGTAKAMAATSGGGGGSTTLFSDTFDRGDNNATLGAGWTVINGTWGVGSNEAYSVSDVSDDKVTTAPLGTANYTVSCDIKGCILDDANMRRITVMLKYVNTNTFIHLYIGVPTAGGGIPALTLQKLDASAATDLGTYFPAPAFANDTYYTVKAVIGSSGNDITVFLNGVQRITYTLNAGEITKYASSQVVGIRLKKAGTPATVARCDNFLVTT